MHISKHTISHMLNICSFLYVNYTLRGGFFTSWAIREAQYLNKPKKRKKLSILVVKTAEVQIKAVPELIVLYVSWFQQCTMLR